MILIILTTSYVVYLHAIKSKIMKRVYTYLLTLLALPFFAFTQALEGIDEVAPFSEGLAAVRKGNQWGFINEEGTLKIDFREDIYWNREVKQTDTGIKSVAYPQFKDGKCIVKKMEDEIAVFGFIDKKGELVIEHQFLNVLPFKDGYTTGVLIDKVFRGKNEFNLNIYEYKFHNVLVKADGEIIEFFGRRYNIQMSPRRYELPAIQVKVIAPNLISVFTKDQGWKVQKLNLNE